MNKLVWDIREVEEKFNIKVKRNLSVLGLDCASKTGYSIAKTDNKKLVINIGFIDIDVSKISDKYERNRLRYNIIYDNLMNLIDSKFDTIVIEDVYYAGNPLTLILLSRIGAIAYTIAKVRKVKNILWKSAIQARKTLGLPCNKKKDIVQKFFCKKLNINLTNPDEIDAIILAINGLLEE